MTQAYPLQWPAGKPRTRLPLRASFKAQGFDAGRKELFEELRRLRAESIVLSTNLELRQDGFPYSNRRQPGDKGIAVYFMLKKRAMVFACDKWDRIEDNLRAITKTIEAIRGIERWGGGEMVEQAFRGFAALPAPSVPSRSWNEVLGVTRDANYEEVRIAYHTKAKKEHPDFGGDAKKMAELNWAFEYYKAEVMS